MLLCGNNACQDLIVPSSSCISALQVRYQLRTFSEQDDVHKLDYVSVLVVASLQPRQLNVNNDDDVLALAECIPCSSAPLVSWYSKILDSPFGNASSNLLCTMGRLCVFGSRESSAALFVSASVCCDQQKSLLTACVCHHGFTFVFRIVACVFL